MDDDDLRRGQPTCHKKFGEALAILAGDALLTLAFQVLAEGYPPATAAACCRELARGAGAAGMVGGQVDDLAWEKRERDGRRNDRSTDWKTCTPARPGPCSVPACGWDVLAAQAQRAGAGPAAASCWNVSTVTAGVSGWPSRSPTTCSTWKATPSRPASAWQGRGPRQVDLSRLPRRRARAAAGPSGWPRGARRSGPAGAGAASAWRPGCSRSWNAIGDRAESLHASPRRTWVRHDRMDQHHDRTLAADRVARRTCTG